MELLEVSGRPAERAEGSCKDFCLNKINTVLQAACWYPGAGSLEWAGQQVKADCPQLLPLKNRAAMYQAAVSNQDAASFSSRVLEEAEVCSLPGGLASIRRQFERDQNPSAHTNPQSHYKQRPGQEVASSSELLARSGMREREAAEAQKDERVLLEESVSWGATCAAENHQVTEEEYYPKLSAKELAKQFEKTIEEAAPNKKIKIRVPKSELCTVCRKRVYPMEGLIADKKKFHKACFSCEYCKNKLNLGNYVSLHGHLYCPPHYKQLFKSKGYFDEVFGQGSQKELLSARHIRTASSEGLNWRHSLSQSSVSSISDMLEKEATQLDNKLDQTSQKRNKIDVVWPPQTYSPKPPFTTDQDVQLGKPVWPPKSESSKSQRYQ